jgi:uncharacterized protein
LRPLLDTNVLLRHLLQDDPHQSPASTALIRRIESGDLVVEITDLIVMETIFNLQRRHKAPIAQIGEVVGAVVGLPGITLPNKRRWVEALDLAGRLNISIVDAFHCVTMNHRGQKEVISWDRDFDRARQFGITRTEP